VRDDPFESVDPDGLMRVPVLLEHVAVVPFVEPAVMDNENPAIAIAATITAAITARYGNPRRRAGTTSLAARSPVDSTELLTSPPF
jgi:hypothetical protein